MLVRRVLDEAPLSATEGFVLDQLISPHLLFTPDWTNGSGELSTKSLCVSGLQTSSEGRKAPLSPLKPAVSRGRSQ